MAQAFSSFDTYLAPFVKVDNLTYKEVKQCLQSFVFGINTPSRWGSQPPFTNITIDWTVPNDLAELPAIVGGKEMDFKYKDCKAEMDMVNRAFIEIMIEGDANGRGFAYPIPTYSITKDFDWSETENNKLLFEMTAKYGTPYFSNYINSDMEPSDIRSMCCRLRLDLRELRRKAGGYFGSGESTGCYDEKTEILTANRGWIPFKDLSMNDRIYTRNPDGVIEIHNPTQIFKYKYEGDMYHFKNKRVDMLVTPNHRMVYIDKHTHEQHFVRADEFNHHIHGIPRKAISIKEGEQFFTLPSIHNDWIGGNYNSNLSKVWDEVKIPMDDWIQFLGWFVSEGSTDNEQIAPSHGYRVYISQQKECHIPQIASLLERLPWKATYDTKRGAFIICNKQLWYYLRNNVKTDCYNARIPRCIFNDCSSDQIKLLINTMMSGDGSINQYTGQKTYYSTSYELMSNLQELLMLAGYATTGIRQREPRDVKIGERFYPKEQNHITYEITLSQALTYSISPDKIEVEDYDGYVYCCEVPNHTLMVRRNGKNMWCGNSIGVVTLNMPRLAYLSTSKEDFYNRLDKLMDIAARSLDTKRRVVSKLLEDGLYPYTKRYLGNFNNHFSTIGLVGMNEACLNAKWLQKDLTYKESQEFTKDVLNHMRERLSDYQEKYGDLFNLEATPAESTSYRFAKHDIEKYPDIITASQGSTPYYTNSSHLPVGFTDDIFEALDIQDDLQTLYTSGTVFHAFLGERVSDWKTASSLVRKIAENYKLPYFTLSPTYSVCKNHGYLIGEKGVCPICGEKTEVYSRITGYYRPIQDWNAGKAQEFIQRKEYDISHTPLNAPESPMLYEEKESIAYAPKTENHAKIVLVGTKTCPNCKAAKMLLTTKNIDFKMVYAEDDEDFVREYSVTRAPTLLVIKDGAVDRYNNLSEIHRYLNE